MFRFGWREGNEEGKGGYWEVEKRGHGKGDSAVSWVIILVLGEKGWKLGKEINGGYGTEIGREERKEEMGRVGKGEGTVHR